MLAGVYNFLKNYFTSLPFKNNAPPPPPKNLNMFAWSTIGENQLIF